jgi:hypothetical protein
MVKAFQDAYKRLISQGHKEAAAYWLAWNFAIKPFLKDLRSILCSVSALHKKLDWLRRNNHKVIFQTFRREFDLPVDPNLWHNGWILCVIDKADPPISANGTYMQQLKYHSVKLEYVARAKILLSIPDHLLDDAHGGVGALWAAYNGLTNPVAVIWEAIPFSWLVDYFVNVGDALSAIEDTDKVLPVDICIMRERRITSVTKGIRKPEDDYPYLRKNSISGGLVDHVWKTREVVHPDSVGDLLSFGFMSKAQATNLLALLMSLARFRK